MQHTLLVDFGLVALIGGVLALDRRGAFQLMVSQPLVVIPLLGFALGDVSSVLWLAAIVQLLWMSSLLVGASIPPNETLASVVIGGIALIHGRHFDGLDRGTEALAVLIGAPVSLLGRWLDVRLDRENAELSTRADAAVARRDYAAVARLPFVGLLRTFVAEGTLVALSTTVGLALLVSLNPRPQSLTHALWTTIGTFLLPALGIAVALTTIRRRRALGLAFGSFVLTFVGLRWLGGVE